VTTPFVTHRSLVNTWECDQMGHMNVQFYVEKNCDALAHFAAHVGIPPALVREGGRGLVVREDHIEFKREVRAGEALAIRTRVIEVGDAEMRLYNEMIALGSGRVSASFDMLVASVDLASRESYPLSEKVRARAAALVDQEAAPTAAFASFRPESVPEGLFETYRGVVHASECDAVGRMMPRFHIARFSDAAGHLFCALDTTPTEMRENGWGTAALDYRTRYLRPPTAGDVLVVETGVLEIRGKTLRFCHCLLDAATGATAATIEIVSVLFDLEKRKSIPLPDAIRAKAATLMIS